MVILTNENYKDEVLNYKGKVVVDFWAPWCGPCQLMKQVFNVLSDRVAGKVTVGMVDITECEGLVEEYKIVQTPTTIVFSDGKELGRKTGPMSIDSLQEWVEGLLKYHLTNR